MNGGIPGTDATAAAMASIISRRLVMANTCAHSTASTYSRKCSVPSGRYARSSSGRLIIHLRMSFFASSMK